ncbi:MAG: non-canonical purine NTP diphosphatase [Bacteroidales bacterium]|nr:non-canonical purine NTP diphosphatase [Bacteroidales bacterium]
MKLLFATNNLGKLSEAKKILPGFEILSLKDINCNCEIPETHETITENAIEKAEFLYKKFQIDCFSDDTGLEVEALNGAPGVYSARYAGPQRDNNDNMNLLIKNLENKQNRNARFHTEIVLIIKGIKYQFEGILEGTIISEKRGTNGFGYDPIFIPKGYNQTLAELPTDEKNKISHRAKALQKMADYLILK